MLTDMQIPIIPVSDGTTQRLIANIQENTVANKDYYTDDQFILNGVLYKVTKANGGTALVPTPAIAQGSTIDIANDCVVADDVTTQIKDVPNFVEGTAYDLSTHKSSNPYTLLKNGYIQLSAAASDPIRYAYLNTGSIASAISVKDGEYKLVWARKGAKVYTSSTSPNVARFIPDDSE